MKLFVRRKLNIGFAVAIILVVVVGAISFATFQRQYEEGELVKHTYQVKNQLESIQNSLIDMETGTRGFRSTNQKKFLQPYNQGLQQLTPSIRQLQSLIKDNSAQVQREATLENSIDDLLLFWNNLGDKSISRDSAIVSQIMLTEKSKMDLIRSHLSAMVNAENELLINRENDNSRSVTQAKWGLIIGIFLILWVVILLIIQIVNEFKNRQNAEQRLQKNYKELTLVNKENADRNWLLNGLAKVNDALQGHLNISILSQGVLDTLVRYVNLKAGAFYVFNEDEKKLQLTAAFAISNTAKMEYLLSEGLVGQAATEREPVIIKNIPSKYATLDGGVATLEAVQAIYAPFYYNDELKGLVELLSFESISHESFQLLKIVSNNIAVAIDAVNEREKVLKLFEQVQFQKEALEHQQEELRQTNEELTVQSEVLQASEEELRVQEEELRQINAELKEKNNAIENTRQSLVRKAQQLEETSKYKSEFLANMSHELRTPLNSVLILAKLLSENREHNLNEKQVSHANIIYRSGSDLLQLINDILDLSKIEAGKVNLYVENVSVKNVATDLEQLFAVVADEKGIQYKVIITNETPEKIKTDKQKVEQILKNLLSNAFKFTSEKGEVKLEFKKVREENTDYISISVKDTGIGIPKAKQQLIFEAFQQADGSTNRKFGGTGLGLSITKELIRILQGKVYVESVEGEGSTFSILLPLHPINFSAQVNNAVAADITYSQTEAQQEKVTEQSIVADERQSIHRDDKVMLIIEDDKDFATIIREFAKLKGYKSIIALTGHEGFYCAKKYLPSAIILDMNLPGINGRKLLKLFKDDEQLKSIPVHVISGSDDTNYLAEGAFAFLKKPVKKEELDNAFTLIGEYLKAGIKRVLILSKNNLNDEVAQILSGQKNYDVTCDAAGSLEEGIEKLDKVKYDCIIADIGDDIDEGISTLAALNTHLLPEHISTIIYLDRDITTANEMELKRVADVVVRKSSFSNKRLLDELELFLYKVQEKKKLPQLTINKPVNLDATLQNKKVLVVDDDMRNIFALSAALEGQQMEVITANDGKEALAVLREHKNIDIVLMDVMMPEMDGYEAIHIIRNEMKLTRLPVIALTAKAMTGDREKCLKAGASDYISKPVDVHKLASLMRVWLS